MTTSETTIMLSNSLVDLDRRHLVHPVSSYRGHEARGGRVLRSAHGARVVDAEGRELIDGFAGLWCVNAGYGQDRIVEAATERLRKLPYATGISISARSPRSGWRQSWPSVRRAI